MITALLIGLILASGGEDHEAIAPLVPGTGTYSYPIACMSPDAQPYFDQGLRLAYGYRFPEAIGSFREAQRRDPDCAMTFLGEALAIAPNPNSQYLQKPEDPARAGLEAIQKAIELRTSCSPKEQRLIEAVARLFDYDGMSTDRLRYERYVIDLRELKDRYPADNEIATIFAGALMSLVPWNYYTRDGKPRPLTEEALGSLERVIARSPQHPGANHYLIHLVENSQHPSRALAAAEILGDTMPNVGHIVHMPAHIYIRLGMFDRLMSVNRASVRATQEFMKHWEGYEFPNGISYSGSAQTHDMHATDFMAFASMLMGNHAEAYRASRYSANDPRTQAKLATGGGQARVGWKLMIDVRFRKWETVLSETKPVPEAGFAIGVWHWARAMALLSTKDTESAKRELAILDDIFSSGKINGLMIRANRATEILKIARLLLTAQLAEHDGQVAQATLLYDEAIRREDALPYIEPPNWFSVGRYHLGNLLLSEGRNSEAESVFWEDLRRFPNNIWSLHGVWKALEGQDKPVEASQARQRFEVALSKADITFDQ